MFICDRELQSLFHEPLYNIAWFVIKKSGITYCLVPCANLEPETMRAALDKVDELLGILNR